MTKVAVVCTHAVKLTCSFALAGLASLASAATASDHIMTNTASQDFTINSTDPLSLSLGGLDGRKIDVPISSATEKIDSVIQTENKAIVIGSLDPYRTKELIVVDLRDGKILYSFFCRSPSVSPDKNFIAFELFAPIFSSQVSSEYRILPLQISPPLQSASITDPSDIGFVVRLEDSTGTAKKKNRNFNYHELESSIFWSEASDRFGFIDRYQEHLRLVVVKTPDPLAKEYQTMYTNLGELGFVCGALPDGKRTPDCSIYSIDIPKIKFSDDAAQLTINSFSPKRAPFHLGMPWSRFVKVSSSR
jgi:hypothetical protein